MEDDEEIMSHPSGGTGSPLSSSPPPPSRSNGRITVTVAAAPPPPQNALTLALPVDQPRSGGGSNTTTGGGREDCWSEGATSVLIDAWGERYLELSRGNLKQKHWKEVADIVSSRDDYTKTPKTDVQCKNRIDTVKKKYKTEKQKIAAGCGPSRWPFFHRLDELIGPTAKINALVSGRAGPSVSPVPLGFSGAKNVPMGIPVGVRPMSIPHFKQPENFQSQFNPNMNPNLNPNPNAKTQFKRKAPVAMDTESDESEPAPEQSPDSSDGFPPEPKRERIRREMMNASGYRGGMNKGKIGNGGNGKERSWGSSVRELTMAILKFGEAYEQAESLKLQQLVEMEKQRMKFAKELELQRMQFFMKTQMELSKLKQHNRRVGNNSNNHHISNNNTSINNNLSDSSN